MTRDIAEYRGPRRHPGRGTGSQTYAGRYLLVVAVNEGGQAFIVTARVGLSQVRRVPGQKARQKPGRMLPECLQYRENDVLRFPGGLRIPPTSNQAERDLRPSKTQQKISGRLRSETANRNRCAIRGYLDTARKHGEPVITAIRDALAGNPLMPAIPA